MFTLCLAVSKMNFNNYGCICVAILTHGQDGGFLRAYDTRYSERDVFSSFDALENSTLVAKPIIFLIQACRGSTAAAGVPYGRDPNIEFDFDSSDDGTRPTESDMLIFHSSFFGRASVRVKGAGTWFIQTVCKQMMLHGSTYHLEELFLKVRQNVAAMGHHGIKQMPTVTSTLLKKLYLKKIDDTKIMVKCESNVRNDTYQPIDLNLGCAIADNGGSTSDEEDRVSLKFCKRQYRVGLNLFNKEPERGIAYLISHSFLENRPSAVAQFFITRKGLSKQMIGEYFSNLQNKYNMVVLECFVNELNLSGMTVDVALRHFQAHFRLPGENQKAKGLLEAFARRYSVCNPDFLQRYNQHRTKVTMLLAFTIIKLNKLLHILNMKPEDRISIDDFVVKFGDIGQDVLAGIYERVKSSEFRPDSDHVTEVMEVQATIVGKKPHLALPHRRLVCICRFYEIGDIHKNGRPELHLRRVFLFNDLLVITKMISKSSETYTFQRSFPLCGMMVNLFSVPHHPFGIQLSRCVDGRRLARFSLPNEHMRCEVVEGLRESVAEMEETMRVEGELNRGNGREGDNN